MKQDFLDEMIQESTKRNPDFPSLMEEARQRRDLFMDVDDSKKYLQMLGAELQKQHITGEILLAGDEMLLLDIKQPEQGADIDARMASLRGDGSAVERRKDIGTYFGRDGTILREGAATIARQEGLPENWLQTALQAIFYSEQSSCEWVEYPGLRAYRSSLDYLLAMKIATSCMKEVADVRKLAGELHITDAQDLLAVVTKYIPEQVFTPEMHLIIEQTFTISR